MKDEEIQPSTFTQQLYLKSQPSRKCVWLYEEKQPEPYTSPSKLKNYYELMKRRELRRNSKKF